MTTIAFKVTGIPKGQPRPKAYKRGNGHAGVYDPGTADGWKRMIWLHAQPRAPKIPFAGPLAVHIEFLMPRPKRLCRAKDPAEAMLHTSTPDADNLAKAVLDTLTQCGYWRDDAQVADLHVSKRYTAKDGAPGAAIRVVTW